MTAVEQPDYTITAPGVYDGIPEDVYHSDPVPGGSLSSSGARKLLPPSCPAIFQYERQHGQAHRAVFDFGHVAHKAVLGVGAPVVKVDADSWRSKAAQEQQKAAHAAGHVPLLAADVECVEGMAAAIRQHPVASALFEPGSGKPEQSAFAQDTDTGIWLRSRFDWLPNTDGGRLILGDYKTTRSAEPSAISKAMANYGYHQQNAFYVDIAATLGLAESIAFVFVFQEKTPPYLVTVVQLDDEAVRIGRALNRQAIDLYAECSAADTWPGYAPADDIPLISLPSWAAKEFS